MKLVIVLCKDGRDLKDQPSGEFEFEDLDEAFKIAEHDLEAFLISKSLVTTFAYIYVKVVDIEAITKFPRAILSYKPSFNYTRITGRYEIEKFMKGM